MLPTTKVTFPEGKLRGRSTVLRVTRLDKPDTSPGWGVVTVETPFHPLDHTWPDQPADRGTLGTFEVVDCLTAAVDPAAPDDMVVGEDIPVRRGETTWTWLALHVVREDPSDLVGAEVDLAVHEERRAALSAAHSGCHLLALALNAALADRWRKETRTDAFGNPDFDALAMASSRIGEDASTDVYRLGKSLRKKGFTAESLAADLPAITDAVNTRLATWLAGEAPIRMEIPGPELTAHRKWTCALPEGTAAIPCGGTHLRHLGELASLTTELTLSDDGTQLTAVTTPKRR